MSYFAVQSVIHVIHTRIYNSDILRLYFSRPGKSAVPLLVTTLVYVVYCTTGLDKTNLYRKSWFNAAIFLSRKRVVKNWLFMCLKNDLFLNVTYWQPEYLTPNVNTLKFHKICSNKLHVASIYEQKPLTLNRRVLT